MRIKNQEEKENKENKEDKGSADQLLKSVKEIVVDALGQSYCRVRPFPSGFSGDQSITYYPGRVKNQMIQFDPDQIARFLLGLSKVNDLVELIRFLESYAMRHAKLRLFFSANTTDLTHATVFVMQQLTEKLCEWVDTGKASCAMSSLLADVTSRGWPVPERAILRSLKASKSDI